MSRWTEEKVVGQQRALKTTGFALGALVVVALAAAGRMPGGTRALGLDLTVASGPTGELGLSRSGPFVRAAGLRAGEGARGSVEVTNQTGARLRITPLLEPSDRALARLLRVELRAGDDVLSSGTLAGALAGVEPLTLGAGETTELAVRLRLAGSAGERASGRVLGINLAWKIEVVAP